MLTRRLSLLSTIKQVNITKNHYILYFWVRVIVFNATFNNISVILWQSVLLVKETGVPGENHRPTTSH